MLEIKDLKVNYGGIEALKGISFHVEEGEIVTLIGANGAGKSTTLRSIMEVVKPASGTITFQGEDITGMNTQKIVDRGSCWCRRPPGISQPDGAGKPADRRLFAHG